MSDLVNSLLGIVMIFMHSIAAIIIPENRASINLLHVALWVPAFFIVSSSAAWFIRRVNRARGEAGIYKKALRKQKETKRERARRGRKVRLYGTSGKAIQITQGTIDTIHRESGLSEAMRKSQLDMYTDRLRYRYIISKRKQLGEVGYFLWKRTKQGREALEYLDLLRHSGAISTRNRADAEAVQQRMVEREQQKRERAEEQSRIRNQRVFEQADRNTTKRIQSEERAEQRAQRAQERAQRAQERQAAQEAARAQRAAQRAADLAERAEQRAAAQAAAQAAREQRAAAQAKRPKRVQTKRTATTQAFGADPNRVYEFKYKVVELDSLITSNTDTGAINPAYDQTLQPRQRDRAASQRQIEQVARNIVPESLLLDFHQLDKGAPIVGGDSMVESGNGRALALRRARVDFPEQFERYQEKLREQVESVGLDVAALDGVAAPVLVRERVTDVDRAEFAREANAPPVLQMSTLETALVDSRRLKDDSILRIKVREEQSIDVSLRKKENAGFVRDFLGSLSENESATLMRKDGSLNQAGIWRIKAAVFTKVFPGESGQRIADTFLESLDSTTKNFEGGISGTLPQLARAESLIASGQRAAELRITEDISKSLDVLARLREEEMPVHVYLDQSSMFERELTPTQEKLLGHFDKIGRSQKAIREFFSSYALMVEEAPAPGQAALFGPMDITRDQLLDRIIAKQEKEHEQPATRKTKTSTTAQEGAQLFGA